MMRAKSLIMFLTFTLIMAGGGVKAQDDVPMVKDYAPQFPPDLPFNPKEWQTNENYPLLGDPNAKKGGTLRMAMVWNSFPPTLRTDGPNSNQGELREINALLYEPLVGLHPETLEFLPCLASHWQISEDKRSFRFRINPKAKWADGSPVTSDDVLASWEHFVDKDVKDPYNVILFEGSYEKPVIEDRYTISVKTKELNWRLFLYFGGMYIFPAKYIRISGSDYLNYYQWRPVMGTGPYCIKPEDIKKPNSLTLTRRTDYWAENERWNIGSGNFDKLKWIVVRDEEIKFEMFKKGEFDFLAVNKAQRWVEECNFDNVQKGWVQKRKIYTQKPQGFAGFAFNMRKPPFNDIKVRLAFCYLFNRERLIEKLFFNEYELLDSYYPSSVWENPNNLKIRYNPDKGAELLAEAGWSERNDDGWLVNKDGKPLEVLLETEPDPNWVRIMKVIKEDYEQAGIKFEIKEIDIRTLLKKVDDRQFIIHFQNWGAIIFPNPESSWMSELADEPNNNNMPGFKNKKVDELCKEYNVTFDQKRRIEIIREIDGIIFNEHPYALAWYGPPTRLLYWNKLGHPKNYFTKHWYGDYRDIKSMWWADPDKEKTLNEAMEKGTSLEVGEFIVKPWNE